MFEDLKMAWREAVENFWHELQGDDSAADGKTPGMRREITHARSDLSRLEEQIEGVRKRAESEREEAATARRRQDMAKRIGDEETAQIAAEFAAKHDEYAAVLERKVEVLLAERDLWRRDLMAMQDALRRRESALGQGPGASETLDEEQERDDREFSRLDQNERARVAEERLEELKRRMGRD
jgi:hypothetical protein